MAFLPTHNQARLSHETGKRILYNPLTVIEQKNILQK